MKNILFIAALIFTGLVSAGSAQDSNAASTGSMDSQTNISPSVTIQIPLDSPSVKDDVQPSQQKPLYARPDSKTRFKRYVDGVIGPYALGSQVAVAGFSTWSNSPEEWGGHWEGFGKRVASNFGKDVIGRTAMYGLDEALKLDSHYYRSEKKDAGSKIENALLSPVTSRNARGKRVIGVPRLIEAYAGPIVAAEAWYPDRYDWKDGVRSGTISLGVNAVLNLFKEFILKK